MPTLWWARGAVEADSEVLFCVLNVLNTRHIPSLLVSKGRREAMAVAATMGADESRSAD